MSLLPSLPGNFIDKLSISEEVTSGERVEMKSKPGWENIVGCYLVIQMNIVGVILSFR